MPTGIRLIATTALKTSIDELTAEFERTSGHKLDASYGPSTRVARQAAEGEPNDVTIVTGDGIEDLIRQGRIVPGTRADIARSSMGLAVQKGAPKPDISTAEKFREAMLNAKSLGMSNPVGGGQSGAILAKAFERLGITEQMKAKTRAMPVNTGYVAELVARGEAELAAQQMPELCAVAGVEPMPLPPELQLVLVFSAGVSAATKVPGAVEEFVRFLTAPAAVLVLRAKGLDPP
jgi:molybdate transport system substrate-binding protein